MAIIDQIGGFSFISLDGDVNAPATTLTEITRPGVDGIAYKTQGTRGEASNLSGLALAGVNAVDADALVSGYASMVGTLQTIAIRGMTYSNFLILSAKVTRRKVVFTQGAFQWLVWSTFTVRDGNNS